jgi:hypothetical protein
MPAWSPLPAEGVTAAWEPLVMRARAIAQAAARPPGPTVTGTEIAQDALQYVGRGYVYGGDASSPGVWDCSSFVSYVLGHDLGLGLPGGRWGEPGFPPTSHGPVVVSYADWTGAQTVTAPAVGDLVCFVGLGASGHIGIVLGPNEMVSALDTAQGTCRTPIQGYGPYGAPIVYRRILGLPPGPGIPGHPTGPGGPGSATQAAVIALLTVGALAGLVLVGAVLAGGGGAVGLAYLINKARPQ